MEEKIRQKLIELAKQKENILAQLNAIMGAEQVLTALLNGEEVTPDGND